MKGEDILHYGWTVVDLNNEDIIPAGWMVANMKLENILNAGCRGGGRHECG